MDDIECINIRRNDLRIKNSKLNKESVDDCITVKIRRCDSHADKNIIFANVMQIVMMIIQYLDIMGDAVTTRQKIVAHNTMVEQLEQNFIEFHRSIDLSRVENIILMNKIDPIVQLWLKIQQIFKKQIINELYMNRQRRKEKEHNRKKYLQYKQNIIDRYEEKRQNLQYRITNLTCDLDYITQKLIRLTKINEKLKLPIKMSQEESDKKVKENEMNEIMEMKDKHYGLQRSNKIYKEQLVKARADLEQLKNEGKMLEPEPEPEPQAPAPVNNNTRHGFFTRKCIKIKRFFMKKFNRRN